MKKIQFIEKKQRVVTCWYGQSGPRI